MKQKPITLKDLRKAIKLINPPQKLQKLIKVCADCFVE